MAKDYPHFDSNTTAEQFQAGVEMLPLIPREKIERFLGENVKGKQASKRHICDMFEENPQLAIDTYNIYTEARELNVAKVENAMTWAVKKTIELVKNKPDSPDKVGDLINDLIKDIFKF